MHSIHCVLKQPPSTPCSLSIPIPSYTYFRDTNYVFFEDGLVAITITSHGLLFPGQIYSHDSAGQGGSGGNAERGGNAGTGGGDCHGNGIKGGITTGGNWGLVSGGNGGN